MPFGRYATRWCARGKRRIHDKPSWPEVAVCRADLRAAAALD
jgi:hypothetical protein